MIGYHWEIRTDLGRFVWVRWTWIAPDVKALQPESDGDGS